MKLFVTDRNEQVTTFAPFAVFLSSVVHRKKNSSVGKKNKIVGINGNHMFKDFQ